MSTPCIVIAGAGHAGVQAASTLRTKGFDGRVVLVDAGRELPYQRPPLSKDFLTDGIAPDAIRLRSSDFFAKKGIELVQGQELVELDRERRTARTRGGDLAYDRLLVATGSSLRTLDALPEGTPGIFYLQTFGHAAALREYLLPGRRIAVVGAGYIGLEIAAAARKRGAEVVVIEAAPRVMSRVTGPPVSEFFTALHEANGVRFFLGSGVTAHEAAEGEHRLLLSDGTTIAADAIFIGVGVVPNQDVAAAAGLLCSRGIHVDVQGRTSDEAIFAAGNVARVFGHPAFPEGGLLECVQNANDLGRVAAEAMMGHPSRYSALPWFWTEQFGCKLQTAGIAGGQHDVEVLEMEEDGGVVAYRRDGRLVAVDCINRARKFIEYKREIEISLKS